MVKPTIVHPYCRYYLAINRIELLIHTNLDGSEGHYERKKTISKGHIQCDSAYTIFLKWQDYINGKQICGCQGWPMVGVGGGCDHKGVWREIFVVK